MVLVCRECFVLRIQMSTVVITTSSISVNVHVETGPTYLSMHTQLLGEQHSLLTKWITWDCGASWAWTSSSWALNTYNQSITCV